jgi:8-oxo-dGTP pyrophosphatase MutT (NUDIX family)
MEDFFNLGIKAWFKNKEDMVLLLKVDNKELKRVKEWKGEVRWDIPGGRIKKGDSIFDTLKREVEEEIGLRIRRYQSIGSVVSKIRLKNENYGDIGLILMIYEVEVEDGEIKLNKESEGFEWCTPDVAIKRLGTKYPKEFKELVSQI